MSSQVRAVSWIASAQKGFSKFPEPVQEKIEDALVVASAGRMADFAKPMKGLGAGVFEIAVRYRTDAYRLVYAVRIAEEIWVVHCFKKKSKSGLRTPTSEIEIIKARLRRLREEPK